MAKQQIVGRKNTSVNLTETQIEWIKANGYEISSLLRDLIDKFMENSMSSEELLKKKRQELLEQQKALESEIAVIDTQLNQREEKKSFVEKVVKEEEELDEKRRTYILSCAKDMRKNGSVNSLWIGHLKEAFKFVDAVEAKTYVLKVWTENGADAARVRKYLKME